VAPELYNLKENNSIEVDDILARNVMHQAFDLYINLGIERRRKSGTLPDDFIVYSRHRSPPLWLGEQSEGRWVRMPESICCGADSDIQTGRSGAAVRDPEVTSPRKRRELFSEINDRMFAGGAAVGYSPP
jgi:hypothetical protein